MFQLGQTIQKSEEIVFQQAKQCGTNRLGRNFAAKGKWNRSCDTGKIIDFRVGPIEHDIDNHLSRIQQFEVFAL